MRLTQEINATFDTELEPAALFRLGTSLAGVASAVADGQRQTAAPLRRIERTGRLTISPSQRGIWYEQRLGARGLNTVLALELRGPLELGALRSAVGRLVARHESLRTRYPDERGVPYGLIDPSGPLDVPVVQTGAVSPDTVTDLPPDPST